MKIRSRFLILCAVLCWEFSYAQTGTDLPSSPVPASEGSGCGENPDGIYTCVDSDVGSSEENNSPPETVGNPINFMTGNKHQLEIDFSLPAAPLMFRRMYNSVGTDRNIGVGRGWRHSYSVSLAATEDGQTRLINQSNGATITFLREGDTEEGHPFFRSYEAGHGHLVQNENQHQWFLGDGRTLTFHGRFLVRIDWPDQRYLQLFYRTGMLESVTDELGRTLLFTYSDALHETLDNYAENGAGQLAHHLESLTLPNGKKLLYAYDNKQNLTKVTYSDDTDRLYHFEDEAYPNHLTGITDRTGNRFATWTYDDFGRGLTSEHAEGIGKVSLHYPDTLAAERGEVVMTRVVNSLGYEGLYHWQQPPDSPRPRLLSSEGSSCTTCPVTGFDYQYDPNGRVLSASMNDLGTASGAAGKRYTYDEFGRVLERFESNVHGIERLVQRFEYDGNSSLQPDRAFTTSINPGGEASKEIIKDDSGRVVTVTERGFTPIFQKEKTIEQTAARYEPIERSTRFNYVNDRLESIDGPRDDIDDVTYIKWDEINRPKLIQLPESPAMKMLAYDTLGRVTRFQIGQQGPVTIVYGDRNLVASVKQYGNALQFSYDAEGRLIRFTKKNGSETNFKYSDAGKITRVIDEHGRVTEIKRDSEGRQTGSDHYAFDGTLIKSVDQFFDAMGRLSNSATESLGTTGNVVHENHVHNYDAQGHLASVSDMSSGARIGFTYNAFGQIAEITQPTDTVPDSENGYTQSTAFEYDLAGQEISVTDANKSTTRYHKDDFGRIVLLSSPDTGTTTYTYDNANNRVEKRDAEGNVFRYTWDAANRMIAIEKPEGTSTYEYSAESGKIVESATPDTRELFSYNNNLWLVRHERIIDGRSFVTSYEYDQTGKLVVKTLPDNQKLRYHYHGSASGPASGTLRTITRESLLGLWQEVLVDDVDLVDADGATGYTSANGLRTTRNHSYDGSISSIDIEQVMQLKYDYDNTGRITGIDIDGTLQQYTYNLGGLTSADLGHTMYRYEYDINGNRVAESVEFEDGSSQAVRRDYGGAAQGNKLLRSDTLSSTGENQKTVFTSETHLYNDVGSLVARSGLSFEYNSDQRPVRIHENGKVLAEYTYNGFGERIKKVVYNGDASRVTYFLYDGSELTAEIDADTNEIKHGVFVEGSPIAYLVGEDAFAFHGDHHGTPLLLTNDDGEPVWRADYQPFGKADIVINTVDQPYRYPGQYADDETGTHYNYYRDYDPATGRFITSDPIGLKGGFNTYAYALNDPNLLTDPLGLDTDGTSSTGNEPDKPEPGSENDYVQKLTKVFEYALADLRASGAAEAVEFFEGMLTNVAIAGAIVFAASTLTATPVGPFLLIAGWLIAGYETAVFLRDMVVMAVDLANTDICNEEGLSAIGSQLAESARNLAEGLASSLVLGGLSKIGDAIKDAAQYAGQGAWRLWRKLRERFTRPATVAGVCSFSGDTLVLTRDGYTPIRDIREGVDEVWSRDEVTGHTRWQSVLAHYNNPYDETVHVTTSDDTGFRQTIKSNRIHPFFARLAAGVLLATGTTGALATEGHVYQGDINGGVWIDAQHLSSGDQLLSANNEWQTIESVIIEDSPLNAFNLSVEHFATYFVAGNSEADPVWVHNRCSDRIPDSYEYTGNSTAHKQPIFRDSETGDVMYRGHDGRYYDIDDHPPSKDGIDGPSMFDGPYQSQYPPGNGEYPRENQSFGLAATGTNLRNNMERAGFNRPNGSESAAHHIVLKGDNRADAIRARELMDSVQPPFDINEASNGVFLPRSENYSDELAPNHARIHSDRYLSALVKRLEGVPPAQRRLELQKIARELTNNTFPW